MIAMIAAFTELFFSAVTAIVAIICKPSLRMIISVLTVSPSCPSLRIILCFYSGRGGSVEPKIVSLIGEEGEFEHDFFYFWSCGSENREFFHTRTTKAANSKAFACKLRDYTTHSRDLVRWAGLARFVGPASSAEVTFIPVLHEKGLPGAAIFI